MNVAFAGIDPGGGALADLVAERGGEVVPVPEADVVVAVGEAALLELAREGIEAPLLSIAPGEGRHVVPKPDAVDALAAVLEGTARLREHHRLRVDVGGDAVATALYDVTLVTTEPARISEYVIVEGDETLASIRSDGVVIATPAGSAGYAKAADGPVLSPGTGLAVVPISPFTTHPEAWVVADGVDVDVVRDDDVTLLIDDVSVGEIDPGETVRIRRGEPIRLLYP